MTIEERQEVIESIMKEVLKMAETKGKDYAGKEDTLANFKNNATKLGMTPFQTWAIYFNKHTDAINNAIKANPTNPEHGISSEPFHGRIIDAITYLTLLACLIEENSTF